MNIYNIKGQQVMLDEVLAQAYEVKTKRLNEQVKRNIERFPEDFCFQLTKKELDILRSQIATSSCNQGGRRYLPFVFTQEGIAMLSSVLNSKKAIEVNIKIMRAFIELRKNLSFLTKFQQIDQKFLEHDKKFDKIFNSLNKEPPKQGIFYDGQIFDAYEFIKDLISKAKNNIILIDNYVNYETLSLFKNTKAKVLIKTNITEQLKLDYKKYQKQYNNIQLEQFTKSHDRFLILDNEVYHIGQSLKDLGKKWFAFSKIIYLELNALKNKEMKEKKVYM